MCRVDKCRKYPLEGIDGLLNGRIGKVGVCVGFLVKMRTVIKISQVLCIFQIIYYYESSTEWIVQLKISHTVIITVRHVGFMDVPLVAVGKLAVIQRLLIVVEEEKG